MTPPSLDQFLSRVEARTARVGVVGLGYVGLPLALRFAEAGFRVLGFDVDGRKVDLLNAGKSYIDYIGPARIAAARAAGRLEATADYRRAAEADALLICVPTPLGRHHEPDLSYVVATADALAPHLRAGQLVSLESTTYPGTTDEVLRLRVEAGGLAVGRDLFLVFSPERVDPGNARFPIEKIPKVVGGTTPHCRAAGVALYAAVVDATVPVSSPRVAEMAKLLENIYRSVNIGLVNELKVVADRMGIDIWEVIDAAATKPFGFTPFYPGPGLGGHCIPIDPFYLTWKAREYGLHTRFIELAGEINTGMPGWVAGRVADALNARGRAVNGSRILILGIAYKKNIDDPRESPAVELMEQLEGKGAVVSYADPHIPAMPAMRRHAPALTAVVVTPEAVAAADCVVVATDHDAFDYELIAAHAKLIVDTRGRYRTPRPNVVKA
ncbi:MAG: nucleotide sugar dehydrogenase [Gemmataceae bacterium]